MVNVLAFNGSPAMDTGNTAKILTPFLDGMTTAGATVEHFNIKQLHIQPCTGELHCWNTDPGHCYIQDDMQKLYPKLDLADILVLATPVYLPLPTEMQTFLNRLCPLLNPVLTLRDGRTRAQFHDSVHIRHLVLVATCGWWELGNFDIVIRIVDELAKDANVNFAGSVLRPHAHQMKANSPQADEIMTALQQAGAALVKTGQLPQRLLAIIQESLITEEDYRRRWNE